MSLSTITLPGGRQGTITHLAFLPYSSTTPEFVSWDSVAPAVTRQYEIQGLRDRAEAYAAQASTLAAEIERLDDQTRATHAALDAAGIERGCAAPAERVRLLAARSAQGNELAQAIEQRDDARIAARASERGREQAQAELRQVRSAIDTADGQPSSPWGLPERVRLLGTVRAELRADAARYQGEAERAREQVARIERALTEAGIPHSYNGQDLSLKQRLDRLTAALIDEASKRRAELDLTHRALAGAREELEQAKARIAELSAKLERQRAAGPDPVATEALAEVRRILGAAKGEGAARAAHRAMARLAPGDRVRIVEPAPEASGKRGAVGKLTLIGEGMTPLRIELEAGGVAWARKVERVTEPAIKVGDRVKITAMQCTGSCCSDLIGQVGTVKRIDPTDSRRPYLVELPSGRTYWPWGWERVPAAEPEIKVGDRVKVLVSENGHALDEAGTVSTIDGTELPYRIVDSDGRYLCWARKVELLPAIKVGDLVRCAAIDIAASEPAPIGSVGYVYYIAGDGTVRLAYADGRVRWAGKVEPVGEPRVGDRVKVIEPFPSIIPPRYWHDAEGRVGKLCEKLDASVMVRLESEYRGFLTVPAKRVEVLPS